MFETTQFVFSLRSPYAWLAARWVLPQLPPGLEVQWRPFFPLPSFENFPPPLRAKTRYLMRDVRRLVEHYGGPELRFPNRDDVNWAVPHGAFLEAQRQGRGSEFAFAAWNARIVDGEHLGDDAVVEKAAADAGLDTRAIMDAALDEEAQAALVAQVQNDYDEHGIFGVPTLILPKGTRYWGHDRIEWAIREGRIEA